MDKYRLSQARYFIRSICVKVITEEKEEIKVRAIVQTEQRKPYESIVKIISDEEKREALLKTALRELQAFMNKYKMLKELQPIAVIIQQLKGVDNC